MKLAKVIAGVVASLGLMFTFGSIGNLDYTEACGQALSAADIFTEFAKAWVGLLIFTAGAGTIWLIDRYQEWKETSEAFKRFSESRRNRT